MKFVSVDFETRSRVDLAEAGSDKYARHPSTEVVCMAYSIDGAEPKLWVPGQDFPGQVFTTAPSIRAWNASFEIAIFHHVLEMLLPVEKFDDIMAWAASQNWPASLGECALVMGVDMTKDKEGKALIQKLSKPWSKNRIDYENGTFSSNAEDLAAFYDYCKQDVRTEMAIAEKLRPLPEDERAIWQLTWQINQNGLPVDTDTCVKAISYDEQAREVLAKECESITGVKPTQRAKLLEWLKTEGGLPKLPDLTADTIDRIIDSTTGVGRRVLELRRAAGGTSTAKYATMRDMAVDGFIRNCHIYHGASTGRWAARGLNIQNFPRPPFKDDEAAEAVRSLVSSDSYSSFEDQWKERTVSALVSSLRGMIKAPEGSSFIDADFSSIENRVGSWIAYQDDKVEMFRNGLDEYKVFATSMYGVKYEEVSKDQRQVAKSAVLGCMFGQGSNGLIEYAKGYGVTLTAERSKVIVDQYRAEYSEIKNAWFAYGDAAINAVKHPGVMITCGRIKFKVARNALWMKLPSGRLICWNRPRVETVATPWGGYRPTIMYLGFDNYKRTWHEDCRLIGSSIYQSAVQGCARDILALAAGDISSKGVVVHALIHDEVLASFSTDDLATGISIVSDAMSKSPEWASDLPVACEYWTDARFRK